MDLEPGAIVRRGERWVVRQAAHAGTRRRFLVKSPVGADAYRPAASRLIIAEYQFLAGLDHPGLLRPVALDPDRAVYADAQCTLAAYLRWAGRLPPVHVANVLAQAAAALEVIHAVRRGHGGVGADALLVGAGGEVVFAEFAGTPFGGSPPPPDPAPKYLAPELLDSGLGRWGPPADLYGLGFLALELLAGDRFDGLFELPAGANPLSWHADTRKRLHDWRAALPHAPAGLLDVIGGLIEKLPAARAFRTAAQLRQAVERSGLTAEERLPPYPAA
jgi:hypothetical protein